MVWRLQRSVGRFRLRIATQRLDGGLGYRLLSADEPLVIDGPEVRAAVQEWRETVNDPDSPTLLSRLDEHIPVRAHAGVTHR